MGVKCVLGNIILSTDLFYGNFVTTRIVNLKEHDVIPIFVVVLILKHFRLHSLTPFSWIRNTPNGFCNA